MKRGMVEAWTGVIREKFIEATASTSHGDKGGLSASQAREEDLFAGGFPLSGAIVASDGRHFAVNLTTGYVADVGNFRQ
jgi:hypothetical protein